MTFPRGDKAWPGSSGYICLTFILDIFTFLSPSRVHDFETCFSVKLPTVCPCEFLPFVGAFGSLDA